jgi:hypothetical protein
MSGRCPRVLRDFGFELSSPSILRDLCAWRKTHETTESTEITETRTRRKKEMEVADLEEPNRISACPIGVLICFNVRQLSQGIKRFRI